MSSLELVLIRGLPGSGKSTLAKSIAAYHLEADMYFIDNKGRYQFTPSRLKDAHAWCQKQCELKLSQGISVVVSNTFIKQWEMEPYRMLANKYQAKLIIRTCTGEFKSIHNVSPSTVQKMRNEWQP